MPKLPNLCIALCLALFISSSADSADKKPVELSVATWNLEWFYDHDQGDNFSDLSRKLSAPSKKEWQWKLDVVADAIGKANPTIIALQEIENKRVLNQLVDRIRQRHQIRYRVAYIEGTDRFTEQDVGVLYQSGLVRYSRREQSREMFESRNYYNLSKHILARFEWGEGKDKESLAIINCHFRAGAKNQEVRQRQARLARYFVADSIRSGENVIILGDFNLNDSYGSSKPTSPVGILRGLDDDDAANDLKDLHGSLPRDERATHLNGKQFDRILVSGALTNDEPNRRDFVFHSIQRRQDLVIRGRMDAEHMEGYYRIPQNERDSSDHYLLIAKFRLK